MTFIEHQQCTIKFTEHGTIKGRCPFGSLSNPSLSLPSHPRPTKPKAKKTSLEIQDRSEWDRIFSVGVPLEMRISSVGRQFAPNVLVISQAKLDKEGIDLKWLRAGLSFYDGRFPPLTCSRAFNSNSVDLAGRSKLRILNWLKETGS